MKHHEGRTGEIREIPFCDLDLIVLDRIILLALRFDSLAAGHIPLTPTADRADINMIDIRRTRVTFPESLDELFVVLQKRRIIVVGKDSSSYLQAPDSLSEQPFGRAGLPVRHDTKCQCLSLSPWLG